MQELMLRLKPIIKQATKHHFEEVTGLIPLCTYRLSQEALLFTLKRAVCASDDFWPEQLTLEVIHAFAVDVAEGIIEYDNEHGSGFELESQILRRSPQDINRFRYYAPPWKKATSKKCEEAHGLEACYDLATLSAERSQTFYCIPWWRNADLLKLVPCLAKIGRYWIGDKPSSIKNFLAEKFRTFHKELLEIDDRWTGIPCFIIRNTGAVLTDSEMEAIEEKLRKEVIEGVKFLDHPSTIAAKDNLYEILINDTLVSEIMAFSYLPVKMSYVHPPFKGTTEATIFHFLQDSRVILEKVESIIEDFCENCDEASLECCWRKSPAKFHREKIEKLMARKQAPSSFGVQQRPRKRARQLESDSE